MRGTLFFTGLLIIVELLVIVVFVNHDSLLKNIQDEYSLLFNINGKNFSERIVDNAGRQFSNVFIETGIRKSTVDYYDIENDPSRDTMNGTGSEIINGMKSRVEVFWMVVHMAFIRANIMIAWLPYMAPLLIPLIIDAFTQRSIKQHTYVVSSANMYHTAFHTLILLVFIFFAYLIVPIVVTPWLVPAWIAGFGVTTFGLINNSSKIF